MAGLRHSRPLITSSGTPPADLRVRRLDRADNARHHPRIGARFSFAPIRRAIARWADRVVDQALPPISSAQRRRGLACLSDRPPPTSATISQGRSTAANRSDRAHTGHGWIRRPDRDRSTDRGAESRTPARRATGLRTAGTRLATTHGRLSAGPDAACRRAAAMAGPRPRKQFCAASPQCIEKITNGNPGENGQPGPRTNSHASIRDFRSGRAAAVSTATAGLQFGCHDMSGPEVAGGAPAAATGHVVGHAG